MGCSLQLLSIDDWGLWAVYQEVDMSLAAQSMSESPQTGFLRWLRDKLPVINYHLRWFILSFSLWFCGSSPMQTSGLVPACSPQAVLFLSWNSSQTMAGFLILFDLLLFSYKLIRSVPTTRNLRVSCGLFPEISILGPTLNLNAWWLVHDAFQFANIASDHYCW